MVNNDENSTRSFQTLGKWRLDDDSKLLSSAKDAPTTIVFDDCDAKS